MLIRLNLCAGSTLLFAALMSPLAHAAEHITLRNGFELDCQRRETTGDRVRLYLIPAANSGTPTPSSESYLEVADNAILRSEPIAPAPLALTPALTPAAGPAQPSTDIHSLLTTAGTRHNIDADLLAAVIHAESAGNAHAVSHAGARGLMQLMPGTAADLGVHDAFVPEQNIAGGSAYLDTLLTRYHDDVTLALAAYNAGSAAVDRYHGIPPYAETRAYVARVIREFNRRKLALLAAK